MTYFLLSKNSEFTGTFDVIPYKGRFIEQIRYSSKYVCCKVTKVILVLFAKDGVPWSH